MTLQVNQDRSALLDRIMNMKQVDDFDKQTSRWEPYYLLLNKHMVPLCSSEERFQTTGIHISQATREDFETLPPSALVDALIRISLQFNNYPNY